MIKTINLNLEDDITKVINKIKASEASEVVLAIPKRSYIFSDSINMRLLKKQVDMLGKKAYILTMDETGQMYAKEAGFGLKFLPKFSNAGSISDIRPSGRKPAPSIVETPSVEEPVVEPVPAPVRIRKVASRLPSIPLKRKPSAEPVRVRRPMPSVSHSVSNTVPAAVNDNMFIPPTKNGYKVRTRPSYRNYIIGFVALAMVIVISLVLVILPGATIDVYAKSQSVARDIDIIADVNAQAIDAAKLTIPATAISENQAASNSFQTLGKKEVGSKAQGRIAIYNLTGSPLTLKAGTTTITVGAKSYSFTSDQILIRASSGPNDPNAPVADIVSNEAGEGSNLPAGTRMEISNQAFGSQPQRLFAKTETQVIGGASRFVSVIAQDDIDTANQQLVKKVIDSVNQKMQQDNRKIVDGAFTVNVSGFTTDKPVGTETPTFNAQAQISLTGLAISEDELKQMIRQRLLLSLGTTKSLQDQSSDKVTYKTKNIDTNNGVMQLSIHYESAALPSIDPVDLKNQIAGKSKAEASELILANPDVDKTEITITPGWQSSLPRFAGKIKLEIKQ